jgi:adenosylhomocysteine nucleosidase
MKFGIIGPSEEEINPFVELMDSKVSALHARLPFYEGTFQNIPVVSVFSGACKVNAAIATQILIDKSHITHLVHVGVAGAIRDDLSVGDIIIPDAIAYHDVHPEVLTEYHPWMKDEYFRPDEDMLKACLAMMKAKSSAIRWFSGKLVTGEGFVHNDKKDELIARYNPVCVDMESAAVAHVCHVNNVPFIVIRSISDNADDNGSEEFDNNVVSSSLNAIDVAKEFITLYAKRNETIHANMNMEKKKPSAVPAAEKNVYRDG